MRLLEFEINGRLVRGAAESIGDVLWVHLNGRTFPFASSRGSLGNRSEAPLSSQDICASMPGKVTHLFVKQGDSVVSGQTVAAMEAMKMEYNLEASEAGSIVEVKCRVGEQVAMGQLLVIIKPEGAS